MYSIQVMNAGPEVTQYSKSLMTLENHAQIHGIKSFTTYTEVYKPKGLHKTFPNHSVQSVDELGIHGFELTPDGKYLIICGRENVALWDVPNSKICQTFPIYHGAKPKYNVKQYNAKVDELNHLLVITYEEYLIAYRIKDAPGVNRLIHASMVPMATLIGSSGKTFLTANYRNRIISVWNFENIPMGFQYEALHMESACRYLQAAHTGSRIAVRGYTSNDARVLDVNTAATGEFLSKCPSNIESMAPQITYDGEYVLLVEYNNMEEAIKICSASNGQLLCIIPVSTINLKLTHLALPPRNHDRKYLVITHCETSPTEDIATSVWELTTGKHVMNVQAKQGGLSNIYLLPDHRYLVTLQQYPQLVEGRNCTLHLYDLHEEGREIFDMDKILKDSMAGIPATNHILAIRTAQDDSTKNMDPTDDSIIILDIPSQGLIFERKLGTNGSFVMMTNHLMHFSGDCKRMIDRTLKVYDVYSWTQVVDLYLHESDQHRVPKYRAKITRDGQYAVWVVEQEGILKVAHIDSNRIIAEAFTHALPQSLVVSEDNTIAVGCDDGRIMLLKIKERREKSLEHETGAGERELERYYSVRKSAALRQKRPVDSRSETKGNNGNRASGKTTSKTCSII